MIALGILAAAVETVLIFVPMRRGSSSGALMQAAEALSGPISLVLRAASGAVPALRLAAAVAGLAGSLATRAAWIRAGRQPGCQTTLRAPASSYCRPRYYIE